MHRFWSSAADAAGASRSNVGDVRCRGPARPHHPPVAREAV